MPEKFEEIFTKYDKDRKGGLSLKDIQSMVRGNRNIMDPTGWIAEWLEWNVSYYVFAKETTQGKLLLKDDAREIIDGTAFFKIAREIKEGRLVRTSMFKGGLDRAPAGAELKKKNEGGVNKSAVGAERMEFLKEQ